MENVGNIVENINVYIAINSSSSIVSRPQILLFPPSMDQTDFPEKLNTDPQVFGLPISKIYSDG